VFAHATTLLQTGVPGDSMLKVNVSEWYAAVSSALNDPAAGADLLLPASIWSVLHSPMKGLSSLCLRLETVRGIGPFRN
jgi:polygalacturonase